MTRIERVDGVRLRLLNAAQKLDDVGLTGPADDVRRLFSGVLDRVLVSTSRGVLAAGPDVNSLRESATSLNAELVVSLEIDG